MFSFYALRQVDGLRQLQANTIDRNRRDSLQLIRIQNDLNSLGLAMRDMVEDRDGYGIQAWRGEFRRVRHDFEDALRIDTEIATRPTEQRKYLEDSLEQLWRSAEQIFTVAETGDQERARRMIVDSLQAQQASVTSLVARLLVKNNEAEEAAAREINTIYNTVERNVYVFLAAMLSVIAAIGLGAAHYNRRLFDRVAALSEQRSTLARRLIGVQEEVFRSVSRELHDDFGQILTAIGVMMTRAEKKHLPPESPFREDMAEVRQVVHEALEKTRSFSQALHPTILDDYGLERGLERYVPSWEKQTGIAVQLVRDGSGTLAEGKAIHVYRILQEALNNVAKHSKATAVVIRLHFSGGSLQLEIEDNGVGMTDEPKSGLGLIAMRERAELLGGSIVTGRAEQGGTLVRLEVPGTE